MSHQSLHPGREKRAEDGRARQPHPTRAASESVRVLNQALAIAHHTVLACKQRYHVALRWHSPPLAAAALEHANDAKLHANRISERIAQLGGAPSPQPETLPHTGRSHAGNVLLATIREHLTASRAASESYAELGHFFAPFDDDTRKLLDEIAANEHERGDDLERLRDGMSAAPAADRPAETT